MIIAYTEFDDTTKVLSSYAQTLLRQPGVEFLRVLKPPTDSVSSKIQQELTSSKGEALFFFGHGYDIPPELHGQDKRAFVAHGQCDLLRDRVLCAICCHAVTALAPLVAGMNTTIIGFQGALHVPLTAPYKDNMEPCALAAPISLFAGNDIKTAASGAETAFRDLARLLFAQGDMEAIVLGAFMQENAKLVGFSGDGDRKLVK